MHTIKTNPRFKLIQLHWQECIVCTETVTAPLPKLEYIHTFNASLNVLKIQQCLQTHLQFWGQHRDTKEQELRIQTQGSKYVREAGVSPSKEFWIQLSGGGQSEAMLRHQELLGAVAFTGSLWRKSLIYLFLKAPSILGCKKISIHSSINININTNIMFYDTVSILKNTTDFWLIVYIQRFVAVSFCV